MTDRKHRTRVIIEPFRIKAVEPIRMTSREEWAARRAGPSSPWESPLSR